MLLVTGWRGGVRINFQVTYIRILKMCVAEATTIEDNSAKRRGSTTVKYLHRLPLIERPCASCFAKQVYTSCMAPELA